MAVLVFYRREGRGQHPQRIYDSISDNIPYLFLTPTSQVQANDMSSIFDVVDISDGDLAVEVDEVGYVESPLVDEPWRKGLHLV